MIRIYLIILLGVIVYFGLRSFLKASPSVLAKYCRTALIWLIGVVFVFLAVTGKLNGIFALVGLAIAFILRSIPLLLNYAPSIQKLWEQYTGAQQSSSQRQNEASAKGKMSVEEAYEVLGLKPGASEEEIIAAHRKLMQKIHPDRGGSDYLAAKINLAKKILINK